MWSEAQGVASPSGAQDRTERRGVRPRPRSPEESAGHAPHQLDPALTTQPPRPSPRPAPRQRSVGRPPASAATLPARARPLRRTDGVAARPRRASPGARTYRSGSARGSSAEWAARPPSASLGRRRGRDSGPGRSWGTGCRRPRTWAPRAPPRSPRGSPRSAGTWWPERQTQPPGSPAPANLRSSSLAGGAAGGAQVCAERAGAGQRWGRGWRWGRARLRDPALSRTQKGQWRGVGEGDPAGSGEGGPVQLGARLEAQSLGKGAHSLRETQKPRSPS